MSKATNPLAPARWIWCADRAPNTYCHARGRLHLAAPAIQATLEVVADSRYQVWINGRYLGQGPTPFKRPNLFYDTYDATQAVHQGDNAVAISATCYGVKHCTYTPGIPGILARLRVIDADGRENILASGTNWKAIVSRAYTRETPRRSWATGWVEEFDARRMPVGWERTDFDDRKWPPAVPVEAGEVRIFPRIAARLEEMRVDAVSLVGAWRAGPEVRRLSELTPWLDTEPLKPFTLTHRSRPARLAAGSRGADPVPLADLPVAISAGESVAFAADLGEETAGQIELEITAPAGVVIDLAPAELLRDGRPWCFRKGNNYARRYITRSGRQTWRCFGYDGARYLHAVVRAPRREVIFHRLGLWRRQAALPIVASFRCNDRRVNRIWEISCRTARVCSQEIHIDSPTREQTSAWGDAVWSGVWAAYLTGDASALRHLMVSAEHVQRPDGQMPCYAFSQVHGGPLFDFSLIAVRGVWLYYDVTGDLDLARRLIPMSDRVLNWYRRSMGRTGLIETDFDAIHQAKKGTLFIDHPGLGWHNSPVGIDRRGVNAAINFFFIHALDAQSRVLEAAGQVARARRLRKEADHVRAAAERLFYDPRRGAYVDGVIAGRPSEQLSQQTNALAVTSGVCPRPRAPELLRRVLDRRDRKLCRCGTYFWLHLAEALCRNGMQRPMWREVVRLWDGMARKGATTWWETFLGDELDSLCHFWSSVPTYLILAEVLGVKPARPGFAEIAVAPHIELLERASGSVPTPRGPVSVAWRRTGARRVLVDVCSRADAQVTLHLPQGWREARGGRTVISILPHGRALCAAHKSR
jgi:alpha-L-rhamnosidase